jgi:hypothetical protein
MSASAVLIRQSCEVVLKAGERAMHRKSLVATLPEALDASSKPG